MGDYKEGDLVVSRAGRLVTAEKIEGDRVFVKALFSSPDMPNEGWTAVSAWRLYTRQEREEALGAIDSYLRCAGAK